MKPSTYAETQALVGAYARGNIKAFAHAKHINYLCAMQRISRFRRAYPQEYREIVNKLGLTKGSA